VPQDRLGRFSTELFERYQRPEKGVGRRLGRDVRAGSNAQGQGGDRATVRARHSVSSISAINKSLDAGAG
jgi:hypothetical protein